ncbi:membrane-targeted effector domain-containing toxin [Pseudomonas koreensis]|uniref:membrane-targeted effector domain-containing toxin n=1 Tax=Pseudomonas koreensis TaxID=198620 RepID=UPI0014742705|nr:membrane-targeted effector domain-containing toxin [Pseudomonas koreensis]NNA57123.1 toxin [Pseudomonas koreensis]
MDTQEARALPNAADKAALKAIASTVIKNCQSVQEAAHDVASDLLKKFGITGLDPDQVYYHRFDTAESRSKAFTGWEHVPATLRSTVTLTQLVVQRFRPSDQDNADLLDVYSGFYTAGPSAKRFNETNEVRLHGDEVLKAFWDINFSALYRERLTAFWQTSAADFRTLAKCNFLIEAVKARDKRQLSDEDFRFITEAVTGPLTWPVTLNMLQTEHACPSTVRAVDIDGHVATNLLRFVAPKGRQIIYLPGESSAFKVLETAVDMHYWVLQRMNTDAERKAFMTHFPLAERQTINDNLTDLMNRLVSTWGKYDHHLINGKNLIVDGDAFSWLRDSSKDAMFAEADLLLTSNGDLREKLWIGYLTAGIKVFGPMAVVGWPVALPVVGASIASLGLNIDQAVNAKTAQERKAGVLGAVFAGIDLLFNLLVLKGPGSLEEVGPELEAAEAQEMADLKQSSATAAPAEPVSAETVSESPEPVAEQTPIPQTFKIDTVLDDARLIAEPGRFKGTYQLASNPSSAIRLDGNAYYVRYESDLNGRGTWAIIDPARPDAFSGSIPVRLNAAEQWEIAPQLGLRGGTIKPPTASVGSSSGPAVEAWARTPGIHVPGLEDPEMRTWALGGPDVRSLFRRVWAPGSIDVRNVLGLDTENLGARSVFMGPADESVQELSEFELAQEEPRRDLISDANAYYANRPPVSRQPLTSAPVITTPDALFDYAFAQKPGLVLGEGTGCIASKRFLIENMAALAQQNVKTLYLQELLANVNQLDLDTFARTGEMSEELQNYLNKLDLKAGNDPEGRFNLLALVKAANAQRIRVQAIDMTTTWHINEGPITQSPQRQMSRSFFASEVIGFNQQLNGQGRWIALVNQENMTTFRGYQGITEQTDALCARFEDVAPGREQPLGSDPGLAVEYDENPNSSVHEVVDGEIDLNSVQASIKGDWRVQLPSVWAYRTSQELRSLLPEPGMFTLQRYRSNVLVVYRNANGAMADSVIRSTPGGRINLDTPLAPTYESMTVDSLEELKQALIRKGMQPKGWPPAAGEAVSGVSPVESLAEASPELEQSVIPANWEANELLENLSPDTTPGKFQGIYRLDSNPSTAIMLDDCAHYVRYESDANGGGAWAIIDPQQPNAFSGSIPVRLNAEGDWELAPRAGLKGGGNLQPRGSRPRAPAASQRPPQAQASAVQASSRQPLPAQVSPELRGPTTSYDTPPRARVRQLAMGERETHLKVVHQPDGSLKGIPTFEEYVAPHRADLSRDARQFMSREGLTRTLPARPPLANVATSTSTSQLIQRVYEVAPGLVIGESQDRIASMQFLIENMQALAEQKVETLYFQRLLNDFNQVHLDKFFRSGEMTSDLEQYLRQLQSDPTGRFTPLEVVKAAQRNGIRVQATDCLASYRYPGAPLPDMHEQTIKTYLTHTIMQADKALNGGGKWVVLTDQQNTNTFRGIAGISELQGGIGLRVEEVLPANPALIETDRGIELGRGYASQPESLEGDSDTLYADMNLQTPLPLLTRTPKELERLLSRQGMFTFEKSEGTWTLLHRGRDGQIARTLVERTADGRYLINRPSWTEVHQVPYDTIVELSWGLSRMGMDLVGRLPL